MDRRYNCAVCRKHGDDAWHAEGSLECQLRVDRRFIASGHVEVASFSALRFANQIGIKVFSCAVGADHVKKRLIREKFLPRWFTVLCDRREDFFYFMHPADRDFNSYEARRETRDKSEDWTAFVMKAKARPDVQQAIIALASLDNPEALLEYIKAGVEIL